MKLFTAIILVSVLSGCHTGAPSLNGGDNKTMIIVQRNHAEINGSKEKIELSIGDITDNTTEVKIIGLTSNKLFLNTYMHEMDKEAIDYYGILYSIELSHIENHLIHDDKAEFKIRSISKEEAASINKGKTAEPDPIIKPLADTITYKVI